MVDHSFGVLGNRLSSGLSTCVCRDQCLFIAVYCLLSFYLVGEFSIGAGLGPKSSTIRFSIIHSNTPI